MKCTQFKRAANAYKSLKFQSVDCACGIDRPLNPFSFFFLSLLFVIFSLHSSCHFFLTHFFFYYDFAFYFVFSLLLRLRLFRLWAWVVCVWETMVVNTHQKYKFSIVRPLQWRHAVSKGHFVCGSKTVNDEKNTFHTMKHMKQMYVFAINYNICFCIFFFSLFRLCFHLVKIFYAHIFNFCVFFLISVSSTSWLSNES